MLQLPVVAWRAYLRGGETLEARAAERPVVRPVLGFVYFHSGGKRTLDHGREEYHWLDEPGGRVFRSARAIPDDEWEAVRQQMLTDPEP